MKRRIETTFEWDFKKFDKVLGKMAGVETNLPVPIQSKDRMIPRITEVNVTSHLGGTEGSIYVEIDQEIGSGYWGIDPAEVALFKLLGDWYKRRMSSGASGGGPHHFRINFELSRKEDSFCRAALWRVISILKDLGITKNQIPNPKVNQHTYVWVSKNKAWKNELGLTEFGWVDFGRWLGAQYGFNGVEVAVRSAIL